MSKRRSWTVEQLGVAVKSSASWRQTIIKLNLIPAGGNYEQLKRYVDEYNINTSHFKGQGWNKGLKGTGKPRVLLKDILIKNSSFQSHKLKKRLFVAGLVPKYCKECGWAKKSPSGHLPLELHHINGDRNDNRLKNIKILCPNCHSLTENYRARKIKKAGMAESVYAHHLK